jgi:CxxC motif-containing protein
MSVRKMICIVCPVGCHIEVDETTLEVTGNRCPRGDAYGKKELTDPRRMLTSTVKVNSVMQRRLPVKTSDDIPKGLLFKTIAELNKLDVKVPVQNGDILIENVLNTGVNIVASMTLEK